MDHTTRTLLAAGLFGLGTSVQAAPETVSVPSTGEDGVEISIVTSIYKPAGASAENPVPVVLHSHGWSGRRSTGDDAFQEFLSEGFAVVSITQRGHGESGGQANVEDPHYEGQDVMAVVDYLASQPWVLGEKGNGKVTPKEEKDPVLFSIGGSYGGGYQWAGMLSEITQRNYKGNGTRFDAIAPQITWYDLPQSLAPNGVTRSVYMSGLYGAKTAQGPQTLADYIHPAYVYTMATGTVPDGTVPGVVNLMEEFQTHGPVGYGLDGKVDVPALMRQGANDVLFNLNQGFYNFSKVLSSKARKQSIFIGYNGGHLDLTQAAFPPATNPSGDPCSEQMAGEGGFTALTVKFFQAVMDRKNPRKELGIAEAYHVADDTNNCISSASLDTTTPFNVSTIDIEPVGGGVGSTAGLGIPIYTEIPGTQGIRFGGIPRLTGNAYSVVADARLFVGLAKGTSPQDAKIIHNNVMPIRFLTPAGGGNLPTDSESGFDTALAGVAATLTPEEKLFLVISAVHPQFIAHGSRTPGGIILSGAQVHLPVQ